MQRLADNVIRRIDESLGNVPVDGGALPEECVRELSSLLRAERFCALGRGPGPGGSVPELAICRGFPPGIEAKRRVLEVLDRCAELGPPAFDVANPTAAAALPGRVVRPLAELSPASRGRARELLRGLGIAGYDVMRVVVCDGSAFLAWVGVMRRTEFTEQELLAFQQVVPQLRAHLALAQRLRHAELFEAGFAIVLEALAEPAFLLRRDGRLVASNRAAGELGLAPAELREQLGRALSDQAAEWSARPVGSGPEPGGYLVVRRCGGLSSRAIATAGRRWTLTRAETRVLERLAQGCSNKEIARALCCSVRTVEIHVSAILRKGSCENRAAVVAELARIGGSA